jgi:hypothetical protein
MLERVLRMKSEVSEPTCAGEVRFIKDEIYFARLP